MQPQHPQNQTLRTQPGANPDMSSLVKVQDKLTVPVADVADHNLELKSLWSADNTRLGILQEQFGNIVKSAIDLWAKKYGG